jgi:O-antigen/teichoic acid export membrane protein
VSEETVKSIARKISYTVSANLVRLVVSVLLSFFVPKLLGLTDYGYWQLYMFYVGYTGFFQFGWADGLYLRYGGKYYPQLDHNLLHSQYWGQVGVDLLLILGFGLFAWYRIADPDRMFIVLLTGINCILLHPRSMLQYLLQGTGRVKEYAINAMAEKAILMILVFVFLLSGSREYRYLLVADLVAKSVAMCTIAWTCRDIVFVKGVPFGMMVREGRANISAGMKLMFANIAGMLIIGIVRFAIEKNWDIATFGKISFSLSISNFVLTFIAAVGIVIFPLVKRSDPEKLPKLYATLGFLLSQTMIVFLVLFYPIKAILSFWLPEYIEAIGYFSILFPICLFETRNSLLVNTYLKALREENAMVWLNGISVAFSALFTFIAVIWLHDLTLSVISIVVLLAFRCLISDWYLCHRMHAKAGHEVLFDIAVAIAFIVANWVVGGLAGWGMYCALAAVVLVARRKAIRQNLNAIVATSF